MSIEETTTVDFVTIENATGNALLTISDHLPWATEEGRHLELLQEKINAYLRFIESGELVTKLPEARGRHLVINLVGEFPLSEQGMLFVERAAGAIKSAGFEFRFTLMQPH
jgi:hypothetical protein